MLRGFRNLIGAILGVATMLVVLTNTAIDLAGSAVVPHDTASNEVCQGATDAASNAPITGCAAYWSNGITFTWTGYPVQPVAEAIDYGIVSSGSGTSLPLIHCEGPDFSVFVALPPGEYDADATVSTGASGGGTPPHVYLSNVQVGASGSQPAPVTRCPPPNTVTVPSNPSGSPDTSPTIGIAANPNDHGFWTDQVDGNVNAHNGAGSFGSMAGKTLNKPLVALAATADGQGYYLLGGDGGIFTFGDAQFHGSTGNLKLNQPVNGMAVTSSGNGYWLVASDGGIFSFGDAQFLGSMGAVHLNKPVVGMVSYAGGYTLVASDGGVFNFGTPFYGSLGATHLNAPIVGIAPTPDGHGYWMVASDGGVFSFGDAGSYGSAAGSGDTITGIAPTPDGHGYWLAASNGSVLNYGDAAAAS